MSLTMSVGRDYNHPLHGRYEFVLWEGEKLVTRGSGFKSKGTAMTAGKKAAAEYEEKKL